MNHHPRRDPLRPKPVALVSMPHHKVEATAWPRRRETLRAFVDRQGWERRGLPVVAGELVPGRDGPELRPIMRAEWERRSLRRRDTVVFLTMPRGGGGGNNSKSIGSVVAMLAVIAIATAIAGPMGAAAATAAGFGSAAIWTSVISATIIAGGSFLVSHFLMPQSGGKAQPAPDIFTVALSGNKARPQQPIPVQYGRIKANPDFCAAPWGDYEGTDQVFHGLYALGVGEFDIEEIGIHDTPVWTAAGGVSSGFPNFKYEIIPPGQPVTLFPVNVAVSSDVTGQQLPDPYGTTYPGGGMNVGPHGETSGPDYLGPFIINPAGTSGKTVQVDFVWPGGCYFIHASDGRQYATGNTTTVEYQYVDSVGAPIGSWTTLFTKNYQFNSTTPVRITESYDLPTAGRVQLRVSNASATFSSSGTNAMVWAGARLYVQGPQIVPNVTRLAVKMVADRQLSQYSSQQLYTVATRKIPVFNGSTWVTQATRNPLWAAVDAWHDPNYGAGQPYTKMDLATIYAQALAADTRGDAFNYRFTTELPVLDMIETILRSIIAAPVYLWDNFSVVRDEPRAAPALMLTDFEILRGSVTLTYPLSDVQTADGTIVEYLDETIWRRADMPSTAAITDLLTPARVQMPGVTVRAQAALAARYLAAVNRYRRTMLSVEVEAEGRLVRRGDQIAVSTEMPATWGASFRVEAWDASAGSLTLHAAADWSGAGPWYVLLKRADGKPWGPVKVTRGASDFIALIDATDRALVEVQSGVSMSQALYRSSVEELPSAAFSAAQPRSWKGLLTKCTNAGERRFRLEMVIDAPQVYSAGAGTVPPLPTPPTLVLPLAPGAIGGIRASFLQISAALTLAASWNPDTRATSYTAAISLDAGASWTQIYSGVVPQFSIAGLPDKDILLRVRAESSLTNLNGPWSSTAVTSPGLDLSLGNLGIVVEATDIAAGALDGLGTVISEASASAIHAKMSIVAATPSTGAVAAIGLKLWADPASGAGHLTGLTMELVESPPGSGTYVSRIILDAGQFLVRSGAGGFVPFAIVGSDIMLQGVTRFQNIIRSSGQDPGGHPYLQLDAENGRIIISDNT